MGKVNWFVYWEYRNFHKELARYGDDIIVADSDDNARDVLENYRQKVAQLLNLDSTEGIAFRTFHKL